MRVVSSKKNATGKPRRQEAGRQVDKVRDKGFSKLNYALRILSNGAWGVPNGNYALLPTPYSLRVPQRGNRVQTRLNPSGDVIGVAGRHLYNRSATSPTTTSGRDNRGTAVRAVTREQLATKNAMSPSACVA